MSDIKETTVFAPGVWDMFHIGHLNVIKAAKNLGDKLVVAVLSDEFVKETKGIVPIIPLEERLEIIAACRYVDLAVPISVHTDAKFLKEHNIDIVAHGSDNKMHTHDLMVDAGCKIVYPEYTKIKSSTLLRELLQKYHDGGPK